MDVEASVLLLLSGGVQRHAVGPEVPAHDDGAQALQLQLQAKDGLVAGRVEDDRAPARAREALLQPLELRAAEEDGAVAIEIADTGPGIPEEELPQVWDELYRGEGARGIPGSGLGLALVKAIINRHGGSATIRSRPGQGTEVALRLPVAGG